MWPERHRVERPRIDADAFTHVPLNDPVRSRSGRWRGAGRLPRRSSPRCSIAWLDEQVRLLARALLAEQRDEGRLAGVARPCRCACPPRPRRRYGRSDRRRSGRRARRCGHSRDRACAPRAATRTMMRAASTAIFDQRAGLELLQPGDRRQGRASRPSATRSIICPPAMPAGPAARASSNTSSERTNGSSWVAGMGEDLERQRVEAVAGEHRLGLAERLVHRRLAAPADRHRPCTADRRGSANRRGSPRSRADPQRALAVDREQPRRGAWSAAAAAACRRRSRRGASLRTAPRGCRRSAARSAREEIVDLGATRGRFGIELRLPAGRRSQPASNGLTPAGLPSPPNAICSIRACASLSRASQWRFRRSPSW